MLAAEAFLLGFHLNQPPIQCPPEQAKLDGCQHELLPEIEPAFRLSMHIGVDEKVDCHNAINDYQLDVYYLRDVHLLSSNSL